jgi:hypothetical protein
MTAPSGESEPGRVVEQPAVVGSGQHRAPSASGVHAEPASQSAVVSHAVAHRDRKSVV